jgi:hypothetical protein
MATRASTNDQFAPVRLLSELSVIGNGYATRPTWISPDGCRLYFVAYISGAPHLFVAERSP